MLWAIELLSNYTKGKNSENKGVHSVQDSEGKITRFVIDPVPGNGSCLFEALRRQINRPEITQESLRQTAVLHVYANWNEFFAAFYSEQFATDEIYLEQMSMSEIHGDNPEIQAIANEFNIKK